MKRPTKQQIRELIILGIVLVFAVTWLSWLPGEGRRRYFITLALLIAMMCKRKKGR